LRFTSVPQMFVEMASQGHIVSEKVQELTKDFDGGQTSPDLQNESPQINAPRTFIESSRTQNYQPSTFRLKQGALRPQPQTH
jgi:hypothetical protein